MNSRFDEFIYNQLGEVNDRKIMQTNLLHINLGTKMKQETYFHTCALFIIMSHEILTC